MRTNDSYRKHYSSGVQVNNYVYSNTSEAYELYPESEIPSRKRRTRRRVEPNKQIVKTEEHMPVLMLQVVVCGVFMAALLFVSIYIGTMNMKVESDIVKLSKEIEQVKQDNLNLATEFDKSVDLTKVEKVATERLDMTKPRSYQVKYIDVPKESYTKQHVAQEETKTGIAEVFKNLGNIFGG